MARENLPDARINLPSRSENRSMARENLPDAHKNYWVKY